MYAALVDDQASLQKEPRVAVALDAQPCAALGQEAQLQRTRKPVVNGARARLLRRQRMVVFADVARAACIVVQCRDVAPSGVGVAVTAIEPGAKVRLATDAVAPVVERRSQSGQTIGAQRRLEQLRSALFALLGATIEIGLLRTTEEATVHENLIWRKTRRRRARERKEKCQ